MLICRKTAPPLCRGGAAGGRPTEISNSGPGRDHSGTSSKQELLLHKVTSLEVLKMVLRFVLAPPSPGVSRGRVRTVSVLRES